MKAGFYSPYFDAVGGAEKHLLDIASALNKLGYQTIFFADHMKLREKILDRFGSRYSFINYQGGWKEFNAWQRWQKTKQFDLFFYQTDGSYFFSSAKKNFAYLSTPTKKLLPQKSFINTKKFKLWQPFYNSNFVKRYFSREKLIDNGVVLYPLLDIHESLPLNKNKIIISVGRFFQHLHNKRHDVLIKAFLAAKQRYPEFREYRLIIVGSYKAEDADYLNQLQQLCQRDPMIKLKINIKHKQLSDYYRQASFYWHAAGYGLDEKKEPEKVEHFGISIIEAMAYGCIPLAYKAGGPKEIILPPTTGFLYKKRAQLIKQTLKLIKNSQLTKQIGQKAQKRVQKKFGEKPFIQRVKKIITN